MLLQLSLRLQGHALRARQPGRGPARERARGNAKPSRRGCGNRREGQAPGAGRVGGATARPWGGSQPRPSGWGAYGQGAAARPVRPAPVGRRSPSLRTRDDRAARAPGRAVLRAPGSLSPRKLTLKDATCGRVLRTALRAALDRELPRQDLGTYQEDGPKSCRLNLSG
jgi:hypothetical protein